MPGYHDIGLQASCLRNVIFLFYLHSHPRLTPWSTNGLALTYALKYISFTVGLIPSLHGLIITKHYGGYPNYAPLSYCARIYIKYITSLKCIIVCGRFSVGQIAQFGRCIFTKKIKYIFRQLELKIALASS